MCRYNCLILLLVTGNTLACMNNENLCVSDNKCLPAKWWCDGQEDCQDGSDESNCDPCNSHPCKNNGRCYSTKFGFRCDCGQNFTGPVCEIGICAQPTNSGVPKSNIIAGATYVRWGRTRCPRYANLVYKGYAGGSHYDESGGGSNYVCLPDTPSWSKHTDKADGYCGNMWGAEFQVHPLQSYIFGRGGAVFNNYDVPCAVCQSKRHTNVLMVPGKKECFSGWLLAYSGMLTAGRHSHKSRREFVCMDSDPEVRPSSHANLNGALFYFVKAKCGSLPCPPYVQNRELPCAVCTN